MYERGYTSQIRKIGALRGEMEMKSSSGDYLSTIRRKELSFRNERTLGGL
jgi:hypothetical protein